MFEKVCGSIDGTPIFVRASSVDDGSDVKGLSGWFVLKEDCPSVDFSEFVCLHLKIVVVSFVLGKRNLLGNKTRESEEQSDDHLTAESARFRTLHFECR